MEYNFDEIIDRSNSGAMKHAYARMLFGRADVMPLWVADMDFRTGSFIIDGIKTRLDHGILGYTLPKDEYFESIMSWVKMQHAWDLEKHWIKHVPGVLPAISMAVLRFTKPGDKILVQPPIYPPFMSIANSNGRTVIYNQLEQKNGQFEINFEDLEEKAKLASMFFLCSPHNPGGRIWSKDELIRVADICYRNDVIVISDEIHADMALFGNKHIPFATVSKEAEKVSLTLMAPSKTFNMAGLSSAFCIASDSDLRQKYFSFIDDTHTGHGSMLGYDATIAAFRDGEEWRKQMIRYVEGNIEYVIGFLKEKVPSILPIKPQASFLLWLDCAGLGMNDEELKGFMVNEVGVGMNQGPTFGPGGNGHQRLNVGTPRQNLVKVIEKLAEKVNGL